MAQNGLPFDHVIRLVRCSVDREFFWPDSLHPGLNVVTIEAVQILPHFQRKIFAERSQFSFQTTNFVRYVRRLQDGHGQELPQPKADCPERRVREDGPKLELVPEFPKDRLGVVKAGNVENLS